ncbi:hypothetical protein GRX03_14525 [Halovenus sp. WSH3]|uniref:Uncharacterized protein n=1 Tax=Halovenus carboxidivorans TaxID=2692199 RepID=A0A6B0T994_9EURY|nr:hypothetical protein [Halovenus carboxidivorans]MXR52816.1 hypothetical protein [Halovenus carboxidivorans]
MCRELNREPAWVAAIKLALTEGAFTTDCVIEEANMRPDRRRTVETVLSTMVERDLLCDTSTPDRYLVGRVLRRTAPDPEQIEHLADEGLHRWG